MPRRPGQVLIFALVALALLAMSGFLFLRQPSADVLARADGWRAELEREGSMQIIDAVLEVAFDPETAHRAWDENFPEGLPIRSGEPDEPGIYGSLSDVDFAESAVVVWSHGQGGSCPSWLKSVETSDGVVEFAVHETRPRLGEGCTDDFNPYRMILVLDRQQLPPLEELPTTSVAGIDEALVTEYPAVSAGD